MNRSLALQLSLLASLGLLPFACSEGATDPLPDGGSGGTTAGHGGAPDGAGEGGVPHAGTAGGPLAGMGGTGGATERPLTRGCTNPEPKANGLVWCAEGYYTRPEAKACGELGEGGASGAGGADAGLPRAPSNVTCETDDDCLQFERGYCSTSFQLEEPLGAGGHGPGTGTCRSGCAVDSDCGDQFVCLCAGPQGLCLPSDCRQDSDCGDGLSCASVEAGCGGFRLLCQRPTDECGNNADCPEPRDTCLYDEPRQGVGVRECGAAIQCGRPFLVQERPRVAPLAPRGDWPSRTTPRTAHLTAAERATLAAHWTKLGQMEHASIAAFARFQLQLLALGAPPELVQACNQALVDETNHTQLCFGLASAYAGRAIGPGPLDVEHSLSVTSLADIVDLVIAEGCVGETNAALEALEAADSATDPVIRSAYARIAEDEQRHAELAFRFVRWALQRDPRIASRVERALGDLPHLPGPSDVVRPCLRAVLAA